LNSERYKISLLNGTFQWFKWEKIVLYIDVSILNAKNVVICSNIFFICHIGASSGIGRELAKELARLSPTTRLVLSARRENELNSLAAELNLDSDRCLVLPLDLENHDYGFTPKVDLVLDRFGQIDVLINNAGISQRSLIKDTAYRVDSRLMNINFLGTITLSKAVLPV
jgi:short-subunit dehydrogenase